ncbi:MAG: PH domain-containing protein [bacterium]|nr:PH domain-containing protein [bacterium]
MVLTIIFIVSIGIVLPIMYFVMRFEGKPKENMLFGVTMKKEYYVDSRIKEMEKSYQRELGWYSVLLLVVLIPIVLIKHFSIVYTLTMAWMFLVIVLTMLPFIRANGKLKRMKQENRWYIDTATEKNSEFTMVRMADPIAGNMFFLAAVAASVLTVIGFAYLWAKSTVTFDYFISALGLVSTTLALVVIGIFFQRRKIKIRIEDEEFDWQIAREKNQKWGRNLGCLSWINAIYSIGLLLLLCQKSISLLLIILLSTIYMILFAWLIVDAGMKIKERGKRLRETYELKDLEAEDDHWIFGIIYYNKEDKSTFVDTRIGSGYSFNMARRGGKAIMIFVILCLLSLPISSIFMLADEFTPIDLYTTETALKVKRYKVDYTIEKNDIVNVELLEKLPNLSKINGTSMDNLKKGTFSSQTYGTVKACLDPERSCFLVLKTTSNTYILSDARDDDTRRIYKDLQKK